MEHRYKNSYETESPQCAQMKSVGFQFGEKLKWCNFFRTNLVQHAVMVLFQQNIMLQGRHFLKIIGRALMLIFAASKRFLPCNAIGIMLKLRNYW